MTHSSRPRLRGRAGPLLLAAVLATAAPGRAEHRFHEGTSTSPIPIHLASNKVHVEVSIGDHGPVWMLLDSGANVTILDRELAEDLGLELRNPSVHRNAAGGGEFEVAFTEMPGYSLPGVSIEGHTVAVIERRTQPFNGHASLGLLGADFFRRFVVDVDYPNATIRFHDPEHFDYRGAGTAVPIEIDQNGKPRVIAQLVAGKKVVPAILSIDTGGRGCLMLNAPFVEQHGLVEALGSTTLATVGVGIGGEVRHHLARVPELRIGDLRFRDLPASLAPAGTKGAYGSAAKSGVLDAASLSRFRVLFDYHRERVIFEPGPATKEPYPYDASGLFLEAEGADFSRIRVASVLEGGPAAAAAVLVGDEITAVAGTLVDELDLDQVRSRLSRAGSSVELALDRDGKARRVEVSLRNLFER